LSYTNYLILSCETGKAGVQIYRLQSHKKCYVTTELTTRRNDSQASYDETASFNNLRTANATFRLAEMRVRK